MNEFENMLRSVEPVDGKTDVMQIMFLAGQQSATQTSFTVSSKGRATGWKLATGILAIACLVLVFAQFENLGSDTANRIASSSGENIDIDSNIGEPKNIEFASELSDTTDFLLEANLDNPASLKSFGLRFRQLHSIADFALAGGEPIEREAVTTPLLYRRLVERNEPF